jgi:hypothetical protein
MARLRWAVLLVVLFLVVLWLEGNTSAEQVIESLGGHVTVDEQRPGKPVVRVRLSGTEVTDRDLKVLQQYEELERLDLDSTPVTDAGLKELTGFKNLHWLDLYQTKVTAAGLRELKGLKHLQFLDIDRDKLTDAALRTLREIGLLHTLARARGTDGRASSPADVTWLNLSYTPVTDEGLKELNDLYNLQTLDLRATKVTDAGAKAFQAARPGLQIDR